jgi:F0F1-type ATP synthase delta subunit
MHTKDYVQATYEVLAKEGEVKTTLDALTRYLKGRGLMKLYPSILRGLQEQVRRKSKSKKPKVFIAREKDVKRHEKEITTALKKLGTEEEHEVVVSDNLIGGYIVQKSDSRVDGSYKSKLLHAYRRLTAGNSND